MAILLRACTASPFCRIEQLGLLLRIAIMLIPGLGSRNITLRNSIGLINYYQVKIFMYRYLNNFLPDSFIKYFTKVEDVHEHYTWFSLGLSIQYARTNYYRFSITCTDPKI